MNQKELFLVSVTVFFTIIAWIVADLYHIATTEKIKATGPVQSQALTVRIDEKLINALEERH